MYCNSYLQQYYYVFLPVRVVLLDQQKLYDTFFIGNVSSTFNYYNLKTYDEGVYFIVINYAVV